MKALLSRLTKFTATVAIVASVFAPGTPLPPLNVQAQAISPEKYDAPGTTGASPASQGWGANTGATVSSNSNGSYSVSNNSTSGTDLECSTSNIALCVSGFVYWITVGIGSWVANITAYVFDYAVMLSLQSGAYALDVIAVGWGIVRDVANMSFLFILVYIAFKIMFQAETTGTTRMLVWVVIVALLVNFSFVMTRVVIDAGNIVALQFYNAIASASPLVNEGQQTNGGIPVKDITASIMTALNPQDILGNGGQFKNFIASQSNSTMYYLIVSSVVYILMGVSLFMVAAVFIFAAVRFVTRVIGLAGLIMIAPAAFVAAIFRGKEGGAKWFNMWLGYLLEFTFYPAVFLFLFYIEIRFMQDMNAASVGSGSLFNAAFRATGTANEWTLIAQALANVGVRLAYIIASLYLILRVSQWSSQAFNKVGTNWVQNKVFGLGRGALKLSGQGVLGGLRFAAQPVRAGIQSQANVATRTGVNSTLWRSINRAVGGTNTARPGNLTLSGVLSRSGQQVTQQGNRQTQQGQQSAEGERIEPKVPDYTGAAPEPRAWSPTRNVENLPRGARIEPVIPMGRAPEIRITAADRNTQQVIKDTAASSAARNTVSSTMNTAAQRAIENIHVAGEKAKEAARAGSITMTLANTPDLSRSTNMKAQEEAKAAAQSEYRQQAEEIKEGIKGLGQTVSAAIAAAQNGTKQPNPVIHVPAHAGPTTAAHVAAGSAHAMDDEERANKIANKVAHKLESKFGTHDDNPPPAPTAPAATKPTPQAHNDDYPYSQAAE